MTSALGSLLPTGDKGFLHDSQTKQEKQNHNISVHDLHLSDPRRQGTCVHS